MGKNTSRRGGSVPPTAASQSASTKGEKLVLKRKAEGQSKNGVPCQRSPIVTKT